MDTFKKFLRLWATLTAGTITGAYAFAGVVLMLIGPSIVCAQQNLLSTTTLSSAIAAGNVTQILLTSTTNVVAPSPAAGSAGSLLYVDGEAMQTLSIPSAGVVLVQRGAASTLARPHATGSLVWIGNGDWYTSTGPALPPRGPCTKSSLYAYPDVHVLTDQWYGCGTDGLWGYAGPFEGDGSSKMAKTGIGDAAYSATVYDRYIYFTALTATRVITLPTASSVPGKVITVADEGGLATSSILIELATVDGSSTFQCAALAYGACTVWSNGSTWNKLAVTP